MELIVALCQFDMVWEDTAANLRTAGRMVAEADADLVKFAKATPEAEQNEADYLKAYYFVEETKPVEEEAPAEEESPKQN